MGSEVFERLDDTLLRLMESLKELSSLRNRYRTVVKEGYFTMSQSRHAMGSPNHVSRLQYDSTMKALVRVEPDTTLSGEDVSEDLHVEFKVHRVKPGGVEPQKAAPRLDKEEGVTRRRKGEESAAAGIEDVPRTGQEGVCEGEELKDPIKWFGILIPQKLRRSQQCFIEAVNLSAELAAAQVRVQLAHRQYKELMAKKIELTTQ